jgi:hypothetical protein
LMRKKEKEEIKQYLGGEEEVTLKLGEMIPEEIQRKRAQEEPEGE